MLNEAVDEPTIQMWLARIGWVPFFSALFLPHFLMPVPHSSGLRISPLSFRVLKCQVN